MVYQDQRMIMTDKLDVGTCTPNLRCLFAVPPEREDIVARGEVSRHQKLVHQGPLEEPNPWMYISPLSKESGCRGRELKTSRTRGIGIHIPSTKSRTVGNWVLGPLRALGHCSFTSTVGLEAYFG